MRGRRLVVAGVTGLLVLGPAAAVSAHPLGNATVNHYDGLVLYSDHIDDHAVEDIAEIPTVERKPLIDTNGDGQLQPGERAAYAARQCAAYARADRITVSGQRLALRVASSSYTERPGAIQLKIGRLLCDFTARTDLSRPSTVAIDDEWDSAGIGWHEITAIGNGVSLQHSPVPAKSISDALLHYPNNLLSSPLDVRSATLSVTPGGGNSTYAAAKQLPVAGFLVTQLSRLSTAFNNLVAHKLTLGVGLLAVALSLLLGAGHAFLPGHGKTIMAAYLVGKRGRYRDVVMVGATVTLTHTAGVLALGLLLSVSAAFAPTAIEQDLAVISGLIVAGVGVGLLLSALRRRREARRHARALLTEAAVVTEEILAPADERVAVSAGGAGSAGLEAPGPSDPPKQEHSHPHGDEHSHPHGDEHSHPHGDEHSHPRGDEHSHPHGDEHSHPHPSGPGHAHPHSHSHGPKPFGRGGLLGLGIAGGLVPSPSALLVLLAAIALHRTAFGIVLVLGYGVGMATALSAAGLVLVRLRGRLGRLAAGRRFNRLSWLLGAMPVLTACLVMVVGAGLVLRAFAGTV